jgi:hypothetical protein
MSKKKQHPYFFEEDGKYGKKPITLLGESKERMAANVSKKHP